MSTILPLFLLSNVPVRFYFIFFFNVPFSGTVS